MITGKDVHVACEQASQPKGHPVSEWNVLPEIARVIYTQIARQLNTVHIEPLQGLVSDMQVFIEEQCSIPSTIESDKRVQDLLSRAKALVPKEGK